MDGQWIDEFARTLGRDVTRRTALKGIALGLLGVALKRSPGASAQDPCAGVACDPGSTCVGGECVGHALMCEDPFSCPPAFDCVDGFCVQYCARPDEPCDGELSCCDSFMCLGGVCVPVPCVPAGQPCPYSAPAKRFYVAPCCDGLVCGPDSTCVAPCVGETGACATDVDCCDGLICWQGSCTPPVPACRDGGDTCAAPEDCCGALSCIEGRCDTPASRCRNEGEYCDETQRCCDGLECTDSGCAPTQVETGRPVEPRQPAVLSLPDTGSGARPTSRGWMWTDAALGGAVAAVAGALRHANRRGAPGTRDAEG